LIPPNFARNQSVKEGCESLLSGCDLTLCLLYAGLDERRMHYVQLQIARLTQGYDLLSLLIRAFQFIAFIGESGKTSQCITDSLSVPILSG
jgi:hypothetical protein